MEGEGQVETQVRECSKLDEIFEDMDGDIFDTVLSFGPVHELKNRLKALEEQEIDLHNVQTPQVTFSPFMFRTNPLIYRILWPGVCPITPSPSCHNGIKQV